VEFEKINKKNPCEGAQKISISGCISDIEVYPALDYFIAYVLMKVQTRGLTTDPVLKSVAQINQGHKEPSNTGTLKSVAIRKE
jgi:hypothetical protein